MHNRSNESPVAGMVRLSVSSIGPLLEQNLRAILNQKQFVSSIGHTESKGPYCGNIFYVANE